jgi:nitrogen fixation NifU-like protein
MSDESQIINDLKKIYSDIVIDHGLHPRNFLEIEQPDGYAKIKGSCGDTMEIFLVIREGKVTRASFTTDGCITSMAAGSMAVTMASNQTIPFVRQLTWQEILKKLNGLPKDSEHCAQLAADTLHAAVDEFLRLGRDSWKRYYK